MSWIKEYTESSFELFAGQVIEGYQPLDFYHFYPLWYDLWVKRIANVIDLLELEHKTFAEIKGLLPTPSNMRALLQKMIPSYKGLKNPNPEDYKKVVNFFARMLQEACPEDPFAKIANPLHSKEEVNGFIKKLDWSEADPIVGKKLGQLITAAGSLVHGLYNDLGTDYGWDAYGPYHLQQGQTFLIRHFPNLNPIELWEEKYLASEKELLVFGIYEGVDWQINYVGCHTITSKGSAVTGLRKYAVVADGKVLNVSEINELIKELSERAEKIYKKIRKMDFEQLKKMVILQESFQLKKIFDKAGIDWKPTDKMLKRIEGKELQKGLLPFGTMAKTFDEYKALFHISYFAEQVLNEKI